MKSNRLTLAALSTLMGLSIVTVFPMGSVSAETPCVVAASQHFSVNANHTITATFQVNGAADCTQPVTLMTWNTNPSLYPTADFFNTQTVFDKQTQTFGVGSHSLTAKLPVCSTDSSKNNSYQADIVAGANPPSTITYNTGYYWTKQADGSYVVVDYTLNHDTCPVAATPAAAPITPAATPVAPVAKTVAPTQLVNTGPGEVAALFAVATLGGALAFRRFAQKA